jgi:hypothetical protein
MVFTHHGAASAADLPPAPKDTPQITKAPPPAAPVPGHYQFGDIDLAFSGVATAGTSIRTTHPDPVLIPPQNGKVLSIPASGVGGANIDDGNLNWEAGRPVSSVAKAFVTVDANYRQNFGVFVRAMTWYDYTLATRGVPWGNTAGGYLSGKPLSENGWDPRARAYGIAPQEAYAYAKTRAGDVSFEGRAGDILVPWGLPTMIPGGFAFSMNAINYAALNRPGVQPEEIFAPTPGAWVRIGLFDRATLEAFSLFTNPRSTLAPCGTLFSGADWAAPGCNNVVFGPFSDPAALAAGFDISRAPTPHNHDAQFGVGGTYVAEAIGTRFGAYYSHVDNTTPTAATITGPFSPATPASNPQYFLRYAEGVESFAFNFMTQFKGGTTLYGEYVYKAERADPVQCHRCSQRSAVARGADGVAFSLSGWSSSRHGRQRLQQSAGRQSGARRPAGRAGGSWSQRAGARRRVWCEVRLRSARPKRASLRPHRRIRTWPGQRRLRSWSARHSVQPERLREPVRMGLSLDLVAAIRKRIHARNDHRTDNRSDP